MLFDERRRFEKGLWRYSVEALWESHLLAELKQLVGEGSPVVIPVWHLGLLGWWLDSARGIQVVGAITYHKESLGYPYSKLGSGPAFVGICGS